MPSRPFGLRKDNDAASLVTESFHHFVAKAESICSNLIRTGSSGPAIPKLYLQSFAVQAVG